MRERNAGRQVVRVSISVRGAQAHQREVAVSFLSRRQFVQGIASAAGASLIPTLARAANAPGSAGRPRMLVHMILKGGMDATLTTDPKVRSSFNPKADLPYTEDDILSVGETRVGPLFKPFARYLPKMSIVNGVVCSTVSHETGQEIVQEMRRTFPVAGTKIDDRHGGVGLVGTL